MTDSLKDRDAKLEKAIGLLGSSSLQTSVSIDALNGREALTDKDWHEIPVPALTPPCTQLIIHI